MAVHPPPFAAALLAGGRSRRMGRDKAWLDWGGEALWRFQWRKLVALGPDRLLISCRAEQQLDAAGATLVLDPPENAGPLPALQRCLETAGLPLLVLAVDMPAMPPAFLRRMVEKAFEAPGSGIIFRGLHGSEPLCAFYPLEVLPLLRDSLARGNLRLQAFADAATEAGLLRSLPVTPAEAPLFTNINRPEDLPQEGAVLMPPAWSPNPPSPSSPEPPATPS